MQWPPAFMHNLATATYGMWNSKTPGLHADGSITPGEGGVDIGTPVGTPVYAIAAGKVIGAGYWGDNAHGVITTRVNVPGAGTQDLYYQHIQLDQGIKQGQDVVRGQRIGTIGPFAEIEMGFNAQWGQPWGTNHPGPWVKDPRPWLNAILNGSGGAPNTTDTSGAPLPNCGVDPICLLNNWWISSVGPTLKMWGEYIAIFLIAIVLIVIGFVLLNEKAAGDAIKLAGKAALA